MKKKTILLIICVLCFNIADAQRNRDEKDPFVISVFNSLNARQGLPKYSYQDFNEYSDRDVSLTFLTNKSGTFVIEVNEPITVNRVLNVSLPLPNITFGGGVRIARKKSPYFHDLSITKLFYSQSKRLVRYEYNQFNPDSSKVEVIHRRVDGYTQSYGAFGFRYEFGRMFGNQKNKLRFGLSAGIEPSFYFSSWKGNSVYNYPVIARINCMEYSLNPIIELRVAKKIFIDLKLINNILYTDINSPVIEHNPTITASQRGIVREDLTPYYRLGGSLQLRYIFHSPDKRRRRSANTSMDTSDN